MRVPLLMSGLLAVVVLGLMAPAISAQPCAGSTFWKNDALPNNPVGALPVAVIQGLCEGEAAAQYFQMPGGMGTQKIREVSVGFGHIGGASGFQATVNVEIYEGSVTFPGGGAAVLPTKIFDLNADTGSSAQIASTALNVIDLSPYNVTVSDDFVVAIRMNFNVSFPGCPGGGAQANFFTDNGGCGGAGKSLLDVQGTGWVDPTQWSIFCPLFYSGQWAIRACTEDAGPPPSVWTDLGGGTSGVNGVPTLTGIGTLTALSAISLDLQNGPPSALMLLWLSLSSAPINIFGGTIHAFPFLDQVLLGTDGSGAFNGGTFFPPGVLPGTMLWFQFLLEDNSVIYNITLSNAVKGTTP